MFHPFQTRKYLSIYIGAYLLFLAISVLMSYLRDGGFSLALVYLFVHNTIMFVLCSGIWFVIHFAPPKLSFSHLLSSHLVTCLMVVLLSMFLDEIIQSFVFTITDRRYETAPVVIYFVSGFFTYVLVALYFYLLRATFENEKKKKQEVHLLNLLRESELTSLKSQINPHFLFNSLNSISSLTITDAGRAQEMLIKLSEYLRYSLKQKDNRPVPISEEFSNCQRYLEIEKIRFSDKLLTMFDIDMDCYKYHLPVLILQPLYENAVKHGVYESLDPVTIKTKAFVDDDTLVISITNNFDPDAKPRRGEGIGLENVRKRLELTYDGSAKMIVEKKECEFLVCLYIPISKEA